MFELKSIYKFFFIIVLTVFLSCQRKSHEMNPGIKVHFNKLNILFNSENRISGMVPVLENTNLKCHEVHTIEKDTVFNFEFLHNFEDHVEIKTVVSPSDSSIIFYLSPHNFHTQKASDFVGILFEEMPDIESIKTYKAGAFKQINNTTAIDEGAEFMLVKYKDGNYAGFLPLTGKGYKGSIGRYENRYGFKSYHSKDGHNENDIPIAFCAFSKDPTGLVKSIFNDPFVKSSQPGLNIVF